MTPEEIEEWYAQKKESLFDAYYAGLSSNGKKKEKVKNISDDEYGKKAEALRQEYLKKIESSHAGMIRKQAMARRFGPAAILAKKFGSLWEKLIEMYK